MAVIMRDVGVLFLQTPHTGSTAIGRTLVRTAGAERIRDDDRLPSNAKHATLQELMDAGIVSAEERKRLVVAAGVRDPFDMLVSEFVRRMSGTQQRADGTVIKKSDAPTEFSEWLRWKFRPRLAHRLRGHRYAEHRDHTQGADHIIRFEQLQADVDALMDRVGHERVEIPRINPTQGRAVERAHYSTRYSPADRKLVEAVYADWIERFGYRFQEGS
jgi:sulfotransferase famil protein